VTGHSPAATNHGGVTWPVDVHAARTVRVATVGPSGWPHVVPLWFVLLDDTPWISTLDGSAKIRHLERDPRASLLFDAGHHLLELHGALVRTTTTVHRDPITIARVNAALLARYTGATPDGFDDLVRQQPRVAVKFEPVSITSWDNRPTPSDHGTT
jgi:PPOX class probable F420-dependent enzyme